VIGHAGNRIAVRYEVTRTQVPERRGAEAKQPPARLLRFRRILEEVLDLALGNPADLIQMETALALFHFRVTLRAEKRVNNHGDGGESGATHGKRESPIGRHGFQRYNSIDEIPGTAKNTSHGWCSLQSPGFRQWSCIVENHACRLEIRACHGWRRSRRHRHDCLRVSPPGE